MEGTTYKILLVEDDKLDQMAFTRMAQEKRLSYDCTVADGLAQAKSVLGEKQFDVVITDYQLGDGTGVSGSQTQELPE